MQVITQQEVMWYGIITELGLRPTKVQYNGRSYGSWSNTFYNRNTVTTVTENNERMTIAQM